MTLKDAPSRTETEVSAVTHSYRLPTFVRTGYQLGPGPGSEDRRCSVFMRTDTVSTISVQEDTVREALGLPLKVSHTLKL